MSPCLVFRVTISTFALVVSFSMINSLLIQPRQEIQGRVLFPTSGRAFRFSYDSPLSFGGSSRKNPLPEPIDLLGSKKDAANLTQVIESKKDAPEEDPEADRRDSEIAAQEKVKDSRDSAKEDKAKDEPRLIGWGFGFGKIG